MGNEGFEALPYLLVVAVCIFLLILRLVSERAPRVHKPAEHAGPHASWRISEVAAPLRRFWHVTRQRRRL